MFVLFHMIFTYGLMFLAMAIGPMAIIIVPLYFLASLIPTLALTVRRMHDTGNPGVYMLIPIYSFILAVTEGDRGTNDYGPDPKTATVSNSDLLDDEMLDK